MDFPGSFWLLSSWCSRYAFVVAVVMVALFGLQNRHWSFTFYYIVDLYLQPQKVSQLPASDSIHTGRYILVTYCSHYPGCYIHEALCRGFICMHSCIYSYWLAHTLCKFNCKLFLASSQFSLFDCIILILIWLPWISAGYHLEEGGEESWLVGLGPRVRQNVRCWNGYDHICSNSILVMVPIHLHLSVSTSVQPSVQPWVGNLHHPCRKQSKCRCLIVAIFLLLLISPTPRLRCYCSCIFGCKNVVAFL